MHRTCTTRGRGRWLWGGILIAALLGTPVQAQTRPDTAPPLAKAGVSKIIDSVLAAFEKHYVYPDTARALSAHIREKLEAGAYGDIADLETLAGRLRDDLRDFTHDKHVYISVMSPDDMPAIGDTLTDAQVAQYARNNYGFRMAELLAGNVGYLRIDQLVDAVYAGEAASAAMGFVANSDALIIDLRYNGGGDETMVRYLSSYFFRRPIQINALYFTETDSLEQSWTTAHVPGRKLINTDLYILISNRTASGAEALSYGLKNAGRATLVGETTAGAAHWTESYDFPSLRIRADIPIARPINPVTRTSWERTGVTPHMEVPADDALVVAHREALKRIMDRTSDEQEKEELVWDMVAAEAQAEPVTLTPEEMQACTGEYADGRYAILVKNEALYWRSTNGIEYFMAPLTGDLFGFNDTDRYRIEIIRADGGVVIGFRLLTKGGKPGPVRARTGISSESGVRLDLPR